VTYLVEIDKTTAGSFEFVGFYTLPFLASGCHGTSTNAKFVLKNLPVRQAPYTVRVRAQGSYNAGSNPVNFAVGMQSGPGCGGGLDGSATVIFVSQ
jgi:hypothetical protein